MRWGQRSNRPVARMWGRIGAIALATSALLALTVGPASAHSQIISTTPEDGAVLTAPPAEVRITFDAPLLDDTDTISVNDADGNVVFSTHPKPEGASVGIPWPAGTKPGQYQIAYRIVCGDGHPEIGALNVTITGAGSGSGAASAIAAPTVAETTSAAADSTAATGSALPLVIAAAVLVGAGVAVVGVLVSRRRKPQTSR